MKTRVTEEWMTRVYRVILMGVMLLGGVSAGRGQEVKGRVILADEPDWNAAEEAAGRGDWDAATDGYLKTLRTTEKPWLKTRAALRVMDVGAKAKRFDAVLGAYLSLVHLEVGQALEHRPALPEEDSAYVDQGLAAAEKVMGEGNLSDDQKSAVLSLELDLYRVKKEDARADEVLGKLNAISRPGTGAGSTRRFAETKLTEARVALDRRDYEGVLGDMAAAGPALVEPGEQEEGLYLKAAALDGEAAKGGDARGGLEDAGLAYMRVVAQFQDMAGNKRVADALAGCAGVLERLKETKIAADLYEEAAMRYDGRPEAQGAREKARRLRASVQP